jgi:hypothetical protein
VGIVVCFSTIFLLLITFAQAQAAIGRSGPWKGQAIDADTKRPLAGVAVLVVLYDWPKSGFLGRFFHLPPPARVFRDSAETVTDGAGRFSVVDPSGDYRDGSAEFYFFKVGYGPWKFRLISSCPAVGYLESGKNWIECKARIWERFAGEGVEIELRPFSTEEERRQFFDTGWHGEELRRLYRDGWRSEMPFSEYYLYDVPDDRLVTLQGFIDTERAALGLPPRRLNGRRQER